MAGIYKTCLLWGWFLCICVIVSYYNYYQYLTKMHSFKKVAAKSKQKLSLHVANKNQWEDLLKCQQIRLKRLAKMCQDQDKPVNTLTKYSLQNLQTILMHYLVDDQHHVILKAVPKCGCSSWKTILINNSRYAGTNKQNTINPHAWNWITDKYDLKLLNEEKSKPIMMSKLQNYFSILTVRHPLDRLESGFREKVLKRHTEIDQWNTTAVAPVFQRFLDKRIHEKKMDKHWRPISQHTLPCTIPFSFIAKTETANKEMEYIIKTKLSGKGEPMQRNPYHTNFTSDIKRYDGGKIMPLFSMLKNPESTIKQLMTKFSTDMKLFGYNYKYDDGNIIAFCDNYNEFNMCC